MNTVMKGILSSLSRFLSKKKNRRLLCIVAISLFALGEFFFSGLVRRTFLFYSNMDRSVVVEDRMLRRSPIRETDIRRYVDEVLLGPVTPDLAPLFPKETRLNSFMYRGSVVYADLSESAALPLSEGDDVFRGLLTLNEGIRRNFPFVRDVRLFIGGNEAFFKDFSRIFVNPADNSKTAP